MLQLDEPGRARFQAADEAPIHDADWRHFRGPGDKAHARIGGAGDPS